MILNRRSFLIRTAAFAATPAFTASLNARALKAAGARVENKLPVPKWSKLPRWRGFNLLEKFNGSNRPFLEEDFQNISDLGFNFVRLPMDYRAWTMDGDKTKFNEKTLSEIDQAKEYGKKYGVHVLVNFHRAPGYTVANPPETPLVWRDKETLEICKLHWRTFAKRYRDVPNETLSFNLFNEPAGCSEQEYFNVVKELVEDIRRESPDRLIICDGINWGGTPCPSLKELQVAQATRGYAPMEISHYGASWVQSENFPPPQWPSSSFNGLLPAPSKKELSEEIRTPIVIEGDFPSDSKFRFRLGTVSNSSEIVVKFNDKEAFRKQFVPKDGEGEWERVVFVEKYGVFQNVYNLDVVLDVPKGTKKISLANVNGDWCSIVEIGFAANGKEIVSFGVPDWSAQKRTSLKVERAENGSVITGGTVKDRQWLWDVGVEPWKEAQEQGIGVMVGEFGSHNVTPSAVALRWIEDMLANWKKAGWGWALWNFRGSFGVANSDRKDVVYEDWRGLRLDRKFVELLQRY